MEDEIRVSVTDALSICGVLMAGGKGTRLAAAGIKTAKTLIPLQGRPIISWVIEQFLQVLPRVVLLAGVHAETYTSLYDGNSRVHVVPTPQLGTGYDLLYSIEYIEEQTLVICNVDTIVNVDLVSVLNAHFKRRTGATIVLTRNPDAQNAGAFFVNREGCVLRSLEDKETELPLPTEYAWRGASTGIIVAPLQLLRQVGVEGITSTEREILPNMISRGNLFAYDNGAGYTLDIGTPERLNRLFEENEQVMEALFKSQL